VEDPTQDFKLIKASRLIDGKGGPSIAEVAVLVQGSKSLCSKISGHSLIPCTSFRRRQESSAIYPSVRGGNWAPAFAGARNTPRQGPSMLLTQALR